MGGISLPQIIGIAVAVGIVIFWQKRQRDKAAALRKQQDNQQNSQD
ncbi:hypothetical protein [Pragia fontium]|nr:hypothetical protein [Pragia fontium]VEJ53608.1 Uncharacterised protein [Pragia fontium]